MPAVWPAPGCRRYLGIVRGHHTEPSYHFEQHIQRHYAARRASTWGRYSVWPSTANCLPFFCAAQVLLSVRYIRYLSYTPPHAQQKQSITWQNMGAPAHRISTGRAADKRRQSNDRPCPFASSLCPPLIATPRHLLSASHSVTTARGGATQNTPECQGTGLELPRVARYGCPRRWWHNDGGHFLGLGTAIGSAARGSREMKIIVLFA